MAVFRILVVDDEPALLRTYRAILERAGHEVLEAESVQKAEAVLKSQKIDLLLCDLTLDSLHDGLLVVQQARELRANTPCIILSGLVEQEIADWAAENNVVVASKPVETSWLRQQILRLLA